MRSCWRHCAGDQSHHWVGVLLSSFSKAVQGLNICLSARVCTPCDEGYHLGMCLRSCGSSHFGADNHLQRGFCIPEGAAVVGSNWYVSPLVVHRLLTTCPYFSGPSRETRWRSQSQKHSSLNAGSRKKDACERTCISLHTAMAGGTSLSTFHLHSKFTCDANRACPGQHVANRSIYINLALLLWSFRISQRSHKPINLGPGSFGDGIIYHHEPFEVNFVPRVGEKRLRELMAA